MATMSAASGSAWPDVQHRGPFVRADLEAIPDDGRRHELIDGILIVSPAPRPRHQIVLSELHYALKTACPDGLVVLFAPLDVALDDSNVLQPDLLVAPREAFTERDLPMAPLLAVEVLSPSTARVDRTLKFDRYRTAGTPSYWIVDPEVPSITVWELEGEEYVERAHLVGDEEYAVELPFPMTLRARDLDV